MSARRPPSSTRLSPCNEGEKEKERLGRALARSSAPFSPSMEKPWSHHRLQRWLNRAGRKTASERAHKAGAGKPSAAWFYGRDSAVSAVSTDEQNEFWARCLRPCNHFWWNRFSRGKFQEGGEGRGERLVWHDPLLLFARIDCFFFFSRRTFRIDLGVLIFNEKGHKEVLSIRLYTSL